MKKSNNNILGNSNSNILNQNNNQTQTTTQLHNPMSNNMKQSFQNSDYQLTKPYTTTQKYRDIFIQKLQRNLQTKQPYTLKMPQKWNNKYFKRIEGIDLSFFIINTIIVLSNVVNLFLVLLSTFQGFLDDFSLNHSKDWGIYFIRIICLTYSVIHFMIKCIARFGFGQKSQFIDQILYKYVRKLRLFLDLISISFQIAILASPQTMWISAISFIPFILSLNISLADSYGLQISLFRTEYQILIIRVIKIALSNILFGHMMATYLLAMSRINTQNNWIIARELQDQIWYVIYINAYYWGCTIMMTVGFGDILPVNTGEKVVTALLELLSCAVLGYNVSAIGSLITQINNYRFQTNRKKIVFKRMIRYQQGKQLLISKQLQIKILHFIQQNNEGRSNVEFLQRDQLIKQLPDYLRKSFYYEINPKLFRHIKFFNMLHFNTWYNLSQKFVRKCFYPKQNLLEIHQHQMIILVKGQIGLSGNKKSSKLNGVIFDSIKVTKQLSTKLITVYPFSLLNQKNYDLIAKDNAISFTINFEEFIEILKQVPRDFQYFFSLAHAHKIDPNDFSFIQCPRCQLMHSVFDCPRLTYMPLRQIVISKYIHQIGNHQSRFNFDRKTKKLRFCPRKQYKQNVLNVQKYMNYLQEMAQPFTNNYQNLSTPHFYKQKKYVTQFNENDDIISQVNQKSQYLTFKLSQNNMKISQQKLKSLLLQILAKHETDYQDQFWAIETDVAKNYKFYFPNFNPWKVNKFQLNLTHQQIIAIKNKKNKQRLKNLQHSSPQIYF